MEHGHKLEIFHEVRHQAVGLYLRRQTWECNDVQTPAVVMDVHRTIRDAFRYSEITVGRWGRRIWWRDERRAARARRRYHADLMARWDLMAEIEAKAVDGQIYVQTGGRDCDMCEWTSKPVAMPADWRAYQDAVDELHECAEGPVWYWIVDPRDLPDARWGSRDLALEAFENGHAHIVQPRGPMQPAHDLGANHA